MPWYIPSQDPSGLWDVRQCVAALVMAAGATLAIVAIDFWPNGVLDRRNGNVLLQPWRGLIGVSASLAIAFGLLRLSQTVFGWTVDAFQTRMAVSFIFGMFVMLVMLQNSLFHTLSQPARGLTTVIIAIAIASLAYPVYRAVEEAATAGRPSSPAQADAWVATAMLAITFPAMSLLADLFDFWPLRKAA